MSDIRYDHDVSVDAFIALAQRIWPRSYDRGRAAAALARTANVGAWADDQLVGAIRVLTDGYLFATVAELLVDPAFRGRGIGRALLDRSLAHAPRGVVFVGAHPAAVGFFERVGSVRSLTGFTYGTPRPFD